MTHHGPHESHTQPYQPHTMPQPYGPTYSQQQPYAPPAAPKSQGLAITALVLGVTACVIALTAVRVVALPVGLIAVILAVIALVAKSQGGKMFAAGGLALGMAALPLAVVLYTVAQEQERANEARVQQIQDCIERDPENVLACSGLN